MTNILINQAKLGDKNALIQLVMLHKDDLYKLSYVFMKNEKDAIDMLDEMILIVYEKIHQLKDTAAFKSWCQAILVNCCKRQLKVNKKIVYINETIEIPGKNEFEDLYIENQALFQAIHSLKPKHQEVINLKYFMDMDINTISKLLKIPQGTVKSRLSYAIKSLKLKLGGDFYE